MRVASVGRDPAVARLIATECEFLGREFVEADSVANAIASASLVFFEWPDDSPDMLDVMRALRAANSSRPPVPVVLLVHPRSSVLLERARTFGAADALLTPPHPSEIRAEILDATSASEGRESHLTERL